MTFTQTQVGLHNPCKDWEVLLEFAENQMRKTASKRKTAQLEKLAVLCRQMIADGYPSRPLTQGRAA